MMLPAPDDQTKPKPTTTQPIQPQVPGLVPIQPVTSQTMPAPTEGPTGTPMVSPPPPPAPVSSAPPSVPTSPVSSGSNLLSSQINPSPVTATAPNTNFGTGAVTAGASPQTDSQFQKYTGGLDQALSSLSSGPNRTQLALQALQDFDTAGQPQLEAGYRRVGQLASKFGRIGSGMTTNDLTGLSATYQRDRELAARGLARDVAEGDINDRYRTADTYANARGQQYGFGNTDRGYNTGVDQYNQGALFDRQRAGNDYTSNYNDQLFGQNRANANDLRGERDYQTARSDKALEDSIRQRMLEETLLGNAFDRSTTRLGAGSAGNPSGAYSDFANQLGGDASQLMGAGAGLLTGANTKNPSIDYDQLIQQILSRTA